MSSRPLPPPKDWVSIASRSDRNGSAFVCERHQALYLVSTGWVRQHSDGSGCSDLDTFSSDFTGFTLREVLINYGMK
jgi:hypothetical protein